MLLHVFLFAVLRLVLKAALISNSSPPLAFVWPRLTSVEVVWAVNPMQIEPNMAEFGLGGGRGNASEEVPVLGH